jgi:hypothetical protein
MELKAQEIRHNSSDPIDSQQVLGVTRICHIAFVAASSSLGEVIVDLQKLCFGTSTTSMFQGTSSNASIATPDSYCHPSRHEK